MKYRVEKRADLNRLAEREREWFGITVGCGNFLISAFTLAERAPGLMPLVGGRRGSARERERKEPPRLDPAYRNGFDRATNERNTKEETRDGAQPSTCESREG